MENAIRLLNEVKSKGLINDYAICGATATYFYTEPISTIDVDILVDVSTRADGLVLIGDFTDYLVSKGAQWKGEYLMLKGIPFQFVSLKSLGKEALQDARIFKYGKTTVKVLSPEYLIASFAQAGRQKDSYKISLLLNQAKIDHKLLQTILTKHGLLQKYLKMVDRTDEKD